MERKRVVITGLGAITPIGHNVQDYWKNLVDGVSGSDIITLFNPEKFKTRFACEVKDFDPTEHFDRKELRKLDRFAQFAMVAADEAMRDSGIDPAKVDTERSGVIWTSGIGGIETFLKEVESYVTSDRIPRFSPFFIPRMISDIAAGHLSIKYGFRGPNLATVSACASSTNALIDALAYIRLGWADIILTGGSEAAINEPGVAGFNSMQAISTDNEHYRSASRPFDKNRDGFVIGEGAGALVVEEYEHAVKRGATIYAELAGVGMSADAYHVTAPHPDGLGAMLVMKNALKDAAMDPSEVDYINVHGTATPRGDTSEAKAVVDVFGEQAFKMNLSSTKSMTGHLLGAAGAIEAISAILAIREGKIPPTINHETDDPDIDSRLNLTFNKFQERKVDVAMSNTFGFGGHNTTVIFKNLS